jgi:hypothetical protein
MRSIEISLVMMSDVRRPETMPSIPNGLPLPDKELMLIGWLPEVSIGSLELRP